jgi:hypothetical protein
MKLKGLILSFCAISAFSVGMNAQNMNNETNFKVGSNESKVNMQGVQSRANSNAMNGQQNLINGSNALQKMASAAGAKLNSATSRQPKVVIRKTDATKAPTDYGTEVDIMTEDFSKFSTGTFDSPDINTDITDPDAQYMWVNVLSQYTSIPGWGAYYCFPAGGVACFPLDPAHTDAHINTPMLDVSKYQGIVTLQFRARTKEGSTDNLIVEAAETHNMAPSWDIMGSAKLSVNEQWATYDITFYGGGSYSIFNIVPQEFTEPPYIYIDDVKVYQINQYVGTPTVKPHSDYKGTSFKANWTAMDGADGYLLNVFSLDQQIDGYTGQILKSDTTYLFKDKKVTSNSYVVDGTESGKTYYYNVRATKGDHVSMMSTQMEVFDLEAPMLERVADFKDMKYTAKWNKVPTAERYNYFASFIREAKQDGEFVVTDENFDGIKDPNGNLTGWTMENPTDNSYTETYLSDLKQGGWKGTNYMPYTDYICLDGWQYVYAHSDAGLISPELDLSKDGGKIKISVKLAGAIAKGTYDDGTEYSLQTQAAIALFNYDETKGDYTQAELVYPEGITPEWGTYEVNLTKGSKRSIIGIYAVKAPENLYIDDLKITQNYKAGESLKDPFLFKRYVDTTFVNVVVPERAANTKLLHKVCAVKGKVYMGGQTIKESAYSDEVVVDTDPAGIGETVSLHSGANVKVIGSTLIINNPACAGILVYDVSGACLYKNNKCQTSSNVVMNKKGAYIVKIGNEVFKVAL